MRTLAQLLLTFLLNACWQMMVVTVFAVCCSWLLRGTAAWCRHSVWVAAIAISLCLPIISALKAQESLPIPVPKITRIEPEPDVIRPLSLQEVDAIKPAIESAPAPYEMPIVPPVRQSRWSSPISLNRNLAALLIAFYGFFLLYRCCKLWRAWRRTTAIMRGAWSTPVPSRGGAIVARCKTAIGVKRVRVVCSASVAVPVTAGVFNPLVILPAQLLSEADDEVLLSAIGHELVHVARRDYILNLAYELIYLPLSFHPAAALLRRRIRQTRELCCDELVAKKLLTPEVYARSLVRLIGSVPLARQLRPDTTIGITDADILEVRIMSLLKSSKVSTRRKTLLLIAACLLLAAPCVAAASFALHFDIDKPQPVISQQQEPREEAAQKRDFAHEELQSAHEEMQRAQVEVRRAQAEMQRAQEELQRKRRELEERVRKNPNAQGKEREELQRLERELTEAVAKLGHQQELLHLKDAEQNLRQLNERLELLSKTQPQAEARMREARAQLEQLQRTFPENAARSRELREQLAMMEKQFGAALTTDQLQSIRRAQEEIALRQMDLTQEQREKIEEKVRLTQEKLVEREYREAQENWKTAEREGKTKIKTKEYEKLIRKDLEKQIRQELEESHREGIARIDQAYMTQLATVSMDRAIQIALSKHPGKVLACSLGRQKDGQVFYRLVIITKDGDKSSAKHVWVSATDGRILKTEHD